MLFTPSYFDTTTRILFINNLIANLYWNSNGHLFHQCNFHATFFQYFNQHFSLGLISFNGSLVRHSFNISVFVFKVFTFNICINDTRKPSLTQKKIHKEFILSFLFHFFHTYLIIFIYLYNILQVTVYLFIRFLVFYIFLKKKKKYNKFYHDHIMLYIYSFIIFKRKTNNIRKKKQQTHFIIEWHSLQNDNKSLGRHFVICMFFKKCCLFYFEGFFKKHFVDTSDYGTNPWWWYMANTGKNMGLMYQGNVLSDQFSCMFIYF